MMKKILIIIALITVATQLFAFKQSQNIPNSVKYPNVSSKSNTTILNGLVI